MASTSTHTATLSGHVRSSGSHHHTIQHPVPKQSTSFVNVRSFGAVGDGVIDDTNAIQNAINTAHATNQGVFFPAGTYLHANVINANGVALVGVGGGSTLLANNPMGSAVILAGVSPSIQNMVVSSALAGSGGFSLTIPALATLAVSGGQNFVVQGVTIIQGTGRIGLTLNQSAVGQVSSVTFYGTGGTLDYGVALDQCANVSLVGNLFLNETFAMSLGGLSPFQFLSQSIAVIGNTMKNCANAGIIASDVNVVDIAQNQVELGNNSAVGISVIGCNTYTVSQNNTFNGLGGISVLNLAGFTGIVSQNVFQTCASSGAFIHTVGPGGTFQFTGNQFGECGLTTANPVISVINAGGPDSVILLNNVYEGHANMLTFYISSTAHINLVSGNAQTQTTLANNIP
jgi:hypothetical protein